MYFFLIPEGKKRVLHYMGRNVWEIIRFFDEKEELKIRRSAFFYVNPMRKDHFIYLE